MKRVYIGVCGKTDKNQGFLMEKEADFYFTGHLVKELKKQGYEVKVGRYYPPYHDTVERYLECRRYQPDGMVEFRSGEGTGLSLFYDGAEAKKIAENLQKEFRIKGLNVERKEKRNHPLSQNCPMCLTVEGEFHKEEVLEAVLEEFKKRIEW